MEQPGGSLEIDDDMARRGRKWPHSAQEPSSFLQGSANDIPRLQGRDLLQQQLLVLGRIQGWLPRTETISSAGGVLRVGASPSPALISSAAAAASRAASSMPAFGSATSSSLGCRSGARPTAYRERAMTCVFDHVICLRVAQVPFRSSSGSAPARTPRALSGGRRLA